MGLRTKTLIIVLLGVVCLGPVPAGAGQPAPNMEVLAAMVAELGLGAGPYVVGSHLTDRQAELAQENLVADTYPGTIKFSGGEFFVVADEQSHLILAVYQRREEIRIDEVQQMVGHLMTRFGEPTTMPHGGLIYWAFGSDGKIGETAFSEAKATGSIDILATVKFSSSLDLDQLVHNEDSDDNSAQETGTIYYIITSDRLLNRYISNR